ncbi:hypothetical protein ADL03_14795 [Nocardia sp. NRRL S-836]|nr:hypothetical protein ADL03_14795 [Nocardia sp. NRRL S-836]
MFVSLCTVAGTAQAAPRRDDTALVLKVQYSDVAGNAVKATILTCGSADDHPRGAQACAALAATRADLGAMASDDRACTFVYAPVEVSMFGFWRGHPVAQVRTFPNSCVMSAHTGALFDF